MAVAGVADSRTQMWQDFERRFWALHDGVAEIVLNEHNSLGMALRDHLADLLDDGEHKRALSAMEAISALSRVLDRDDD